MTLWRILVHLTTINLTPFIIQKFTSFERHTFISSWIQINLGMILFHLKSFVAKRHQLLIALQMSPWGLGEGNSVIHVLSQSWGKNSFIKIGPMLTRFVTRFLLISKAFFNGIRCILQPNYSLFQHFSSSVANYQFLFQFEALSLLTYHSWVAKCSVSK